jgi:hypothetical protein
VRGSAPKRWRLRAVAGAALALLCAAAAIASGSTTHDLRGTWVRSGAYGSLDAITSMDLATGRFSGRGIARNGTGYTWPDSGTVSGASVTWHVGPYDQLSQYTAVCKGTISAAGDAISGSCHDSYGHSVSWMLTRVSTTPDPAAQPLVAAPTKGTVLVRQPGSHTFVPLTSATMLPSGATVDVTNGWIRLGSGATSAQFYRGEFLFERTAGDGTRLTLDGGAPCPAAGARAAAAAAKPLRKEKLWGTGHGKFTTVGNFASASVIGTHWLTWNTCTGTEIRVASGEVRVTDLVKHRTFVLRAPNQYTAQR